MKFVLPRAVYLVAVVAVTAILAGTATARAAATESFDALRVELVGRASVLTGSVDKAQQKQGKACLKVIATIDKSATLATDIKTAGKVAKSLAKAFPDDFLELTQLQGGSITTNLATLLDSAFSNLVAEVQSELDAVQIDINALPPGSAKDSAQELHDAAQTLLNQAGTNPDFALAAKAIASSLKSVLKAAQVVIKATTSGGGGGGGAGFSCKVNGANFTPLATLCTFTSLTGELTVTGTSLQRSVTIIASGVTGIGTYPAEGAQVQEVGSGVNYASTMTGTITITQFNLAQQKAVGTFSFSVSQTTPVPDTNNVVNVTQGSFNVSAITQF